MNDDARWDASNPCLGEIRDALQGKGEWRPQLEQPIGEDAANGAMGEREAQLSARINPTLPATPEQEKQLDAVLDRIFSEPERCYAPSCGKWDGNDSCTCQHAALAAEKAAAEPVAWMIRIGDSNVWSYTQLESDADFYGKQSGMKYEKRPLYAAPQQPAQSAEQDERAAFVSGRDVEELFLRWSEWTTELGEAISRKNIDGFVSDLRALVAAQPADGGKS
jgi:hypothetical protein